MKKEKLKRVLCSMGIVMCLSTLLIGCSSEVDEVGNVVSRSVQSKFDTFIDVDPEVIESGFLETTGKELNLYMEALYRFDSFVGIEDGLLKYNGGTNEDLKISEYLFELFTEKLKKTNRNIQIGYLVVVDDKLYSSTSLNNKKNVVRLKSRSLEPCGHNYTPGRLDGSEQEVGQTILDGMKQFFYASNTGQSYGNIVDYVDLQSYDDWSQSNSTLSGNFVFNNTSCEYSLSNLNAAANGTGHNELCTSDFNSDKVNNIYEISLVACEYQSDVILIRTRDYDTYLKLLEYVGAN